MTLSLFSCAYWPFVYFGGEMSIQVLWLFKLDCLFIIKFRNFCIFWIYPIRHQFSSVHSLSRVRLFVTPWIAARQPSLSITNSRSSLRLMYIESVMPSSHLGRSLLLLPPIPPSSRIFPNESGLRIRWPKYWSFSFNISPSLSNMHLSFLHFLLWLDSSFFSVLFLCLYVLQFI